MKFVLDLDNLESLMRQKELIERAIAIVNFALGDSGKQGDPGEKGGVSQPVNKDQLC